MGTKRSDAMPPPAESVDVLLGESESVTFAVVTLDLLKSAPAELTPAELGVLACVARGMSNDEIAKARGSAERTVANQVASLFRKLGVHSRQELVARLYGGGPP